MLYAAAIAPKIVFSLITYIWPEGTKLAVNLDFALNVHKTPVTDTLNRLRQSPAASRILYKPKERWCLVNTPTFGTDQSLPQLGAELLSVPFLLPSESCFFSPPQFYSVHV